MRIMDGRNGARFWVRDTLNDPNWVREATYPGAATGDDVVWLDVGGHIGIFAVRMAKACRHVHAFEPEPENRHLLRKNIALNGVQNVSVYEHAVVGGEPSPRTLRVSPRSSAAHSLHKTERLPGMVVPSIHIADALDVSGATHVKIDCEGEEQHILPAINWRERGIRELWFEWHFGPTHDADWRKYFSVLATLDTQFETVLGSRQRTKTWNTTVYCGRNG